MKQNLSFFFKQRIEGFVCKRWRPAALLITEEEVCLNLSMSCWGLEGRTSWQQGSVKTKDNTSQNKKTAHFPKWPWVQLEGKVREQRAVHLRFVSLSASMNVNLFFSWYSLEPFDVFGRTWDKTGKHSDLSEAPKPRLRLCRNFPCSLWVHLGSTGRWLECALIFLQLSAGFTMCYQMYRFY